MIPAQLSELIAQCSPIELQALHTMWVTHGVGCKKVNKSRALVATVGAADPTDDVLDLMPFKTAPDMSVRKVLDSRVDEVSEEFARTWCGMLVSMPAEFADDDGPAAAFAPTVEDDSKPLGRMTMLMFPDGEGFAFVTDSVGVKLAITRLDNPELRTTEVYRKLRRLVIRINLACKEWKEKATDADA